MTKLINTEPNITVLMSCFNATKWLNEAVNSVINQTYKDFEFIIVDDGSTDDTLKLIKDLSAIDSRIVVIAKHNTGLADSLNIGIQQARGQWVARLDADDLCEPTRLEKQIAYAHQHSDLVFIGSGLVKINANGHLLRSYRYPTYHASLLDNLRNLQRFPPHSSAFYRTQVVRAIGGYRVRIRRAEDWDLWLRLSEIGNFACMPEPLVRIRQHDEQISHEDFGKRQIVDAVSAVTSYFIRQYGVADPVAGNEAEFQAFRTWIEQRLKEEKFFELRQFRAQLRACFYKQSNPINGESTIRKGLLNPFLLWRLCQEQLFGSALPRQFAQEWIGQSCVAL